MPYVSDRPKGLIGARQIERREKASGKGRRFSAVPPRPSKPTVDPQGRKICVQGALQHTRG